MGDSVVPDTQPPPPPPPEPLVESVVEQQTSPHHVEEHASYTLSWDVTAEGAMAWRVVLHRPASRVEPVAERALDEG